MSIGGFTIGGTAGSPPAYGLAVSGSIGIGTRVPTARLHISGAASENLLRVDSLASSSILFVSGSGNIGIGTSTPSQKLTVGTADSDAILINAGGKLYFRDTTTSISEGSGLNLVSGATRNINFNAGNSVRMVVSASGNVGIGETAPTARLEVKGSGTTSATTALRVEDSNSTPSLIVLDNGWVGVDTIPSSASLHVNGNAYISASFSTSSAALTVYKSGSTVLDVQGSQGQLFSITDSLSGSLFSVNDISGLPILEVFSDNTILMGDYIAPSLNTTEKLTVNSGITTLYAVPTASYDSAIFEYNIRSGSNARAGSITGIWSGSSVNFTETTTTSFGSTAGFVLGMSVSGSSMILSSSAATSGWTFKTIIRSI
jgi:hypothetical protein